MHLRSFLAANLLLLAALGCNKAEFPSEPQPTRELATATASTPLVFRQVSAGGIHTCGVTTDDRAYCWGGNNLGQLGDGTTTQRLRPVAVAGGLRFKTITAGANYTCGITTGDKSYCWGNGYDGELGAFEGTGTQPAFVTVPFLVAGDFLTKQIWAGGGKDSVRAHHTCALTLQNLAYCWGNNVTGQVGNGTTICCAEFFLPVKVAGGRRFAQVSVGIDHTCAVNPNGRAFCWGGNGAGELGDRTHTNRYAPTAVSGGALRFRQVSAGGHVYFDLSVFRDFGGYTCALSTEDRAYCWGDNRYGKLGNDSPQNSSIPRAVSGDRRYQQISAGETHACAVSLANQAYCWGRNLSGDLGDGTDAFRQRHPVPVAGDFQFSTVSAGDEHTCAVTATGAAYCWGGNADGQLGDGTTTTRRTPITVSGP
ncbi:MAG TPA: hypothetical protein VIG08_08130 [Gemmatimonadales bacterium]|jgi:alpha-tubulin suppressor-like RCC1 family protein